MVEHLSRLTFLALLLTYLAFGGLMAVAVIRGLLWVYFG